MAADTGNGSTAGQFWRGEEGRREEIGEVAACVAEVEVYSVSIL